MASFRDQTTHVLHGSYQQLGNDLDVAYKLMVEFERGGEIDQDGLEVALSEARRSFEHWVEVLRERAGQAGPLAVAPDEVPTPRVIM